MKKLIGIISVLMILCIQTASADMIVTPNNDFYNEHYEECETVQHFAFTQAEILLYESPVSDEVIGTIDKGERIFLSFSYIDPATEELWYVHILPNEEFAGVWMKSDKLEIIENNEDFIEDHLHEITTLKEYEKMHVNEEGYVAVWEYPNSNQLNYYLDTAYAYEGTGEDFYLLVWQIYTDKDNHEWLWVSSSKKRVFGWINKDELVIKEPDLDVNPYAYVIDMPSSEQVDLPPFPEPAIDPVQEAMNKTGNQTMMLAGLLVVVLAVVTAFVIKFFWKKK